MDRHTERGTRIFYLGLYSTDGTPKCHVPPSKQSMGVSPKLCLAGEGGQGGTGKPGDGPGRFYTVLCGLQGSPLLPKGPHSDCPRGEVD